MADNPPRRRGWRIVLIVGLAICLLIAGYAAYTGIEHMVLRAQLRRMDRQMKVLQEKLDQYEAVLQLLNDSSFARLADSFGFPRPDSAAR